MVNPKVQLVDVVHHVKPNGTSDRIALGFTKLLRAVADGFFAKRYGHRAIVLETVAAVPGMVGATMTICSCLRRMCDDRGWIRTLMEEAENERMHLMTFIEVAQPSAFERFLIIAVQWVFYHRLLRPLSGQPIDRAPRRRLFRGRGGDQLQLLLAEIDAGRSPNIPAPAIAQRLLGAARRCALRDVVLVVRADEAASPRRQPWLRQCTGRPRKWTTR